MKLILTLTALVASTSLALAAEGDKPKKPAEEGKAKRNPEEVFKKLDANADGSVSKDEFLAAPFAKADSAKAEKRFTAQDKDKDGKLSKEEFTAQGGKGKKPESK